MNPADTTGKIPIQARGTDHPRYLTPTSQQMPPCAGLKSGTRLLCRVKKPDCQPVHSLVDKGPQCVRIGHNDRARGNLHQLLFNQ
jgi:hypothetical protein